MPVHVPVVRREYRLERIGAVRLIGLEKTGLFERQQRGSGEAHHHVGPGIVLLGEEARGDDTGGVAHPLHLGFGDGGLDRLLEGSELFIFQRGIDRDLLGVRGLRHPTIGGGEREAERGPP